MQTNQMTAEQTNEMIKADLLQLRVLNTTISTYLIELAENPDDYNVTVDQVNQYLDNLLS